MPWGAVVHHEGAGCCGVPLWAVCHQMILCALEWSHMLWVGGRKWPQGCTLRGGAGPWGLGELCRSTKGPYVVYCGFMLWVGPVLCLGSNGSRWALYCAIGAVCPGVGPSVVGECVLRSGDVCYKGILSCGRLHAGALCCGVEPCFLVGHLLWGRH